MFDNLRAEMRRRSKTNADVGKILGISGNSVSAKLNKKVAFTLDEMRKLADEFVCTIDYLAVEHSPKPDTAA